jgi:hypothetical protein
MQAVDGVELLLSEAYDEAVITEVIRPAAVLPEEAARCVLMELALRDVRAGGHWWSEPTMWRRYDATWDGADGSAGNARLIGTVQVAYGVPTRYEITIFRATVTTLGTERGWTVQSLCNEALGFGGLSLDTCPRADLQVPPRPFRLTDHDGEPT